MPVKEETPAGMTLAARQPARLLYLTARRICFRASRSPCPARRMASSSSVDPFGHPGQADGYARFRPRYPRELLEQVTSSALKQAGVEKGEGVLVDVCTGTGVLVAQIADNFREAYGFDRSAAQLAAATPVPNVKYAQADAYQIPLPDASVDVITIAQGIHWLDIPRFGAECARLLKPQGTMVALGYGAPQLDDEGGQEAFLRWYEGLEGLWECDRHLLDTALEGADYGPALRAVQKQQVMEASELSMGQFVGYLRTWSAYNTWRARHPAPEPDSVDQLQARLEQQAAAGAGSRPVVVRLKTPFFAVHTVKT